MKKIVFIMILFLHLGLFAEEITLEILREKALENSPLQNKLLYNESRLMMEDKNLLVNYYPTVSFTARATYQSDVFNLPIELPANMGTIPEISKDQYNLQFDINQTIYDGGATKSLREIKKAETRLNNSAIQVNLYQINNVINELYFGVLKSNAGIESLQLIQEDITNKRVVLESAVANGVLLKSDLNALDIELSKIEQQLTELESNKSTLIGMLEKWTEIDLIDSKFEIPEEPIMTTDNERPELQMFEKQKSLTNSSKEMIKSKYMPKVGAFVQAGYGKPTPVNFFSEDFETYYKAGIQMQWDLWQWNKHGREIEIVEIQKESIQTDEKNFLKVNNIEKTKYLKNIEKYNQLLNSDEKMIALQKENIEVVFSKLQNGTINSTEYISEQNILTRFVINKELHKLELLKSKYDLLYTKGAFNNFNGDK